jgi:hypothetical protein
MLIRIQVDTVDPAGACDAAGVEKMTTECSGRIPVCVSHAGAPELSPRELRRKRTFRAADRRWCNDQYGRNRHSWLNWRLADGGNERRNALRWCVDWKSLVPSMSTARASGE